MTRQADNPLLARFNGEPSLFDPAFAPQIATNLDAVMRNEHAHELLAASGDDTFWPDASDWRAAYRPYVVKDGVLQIPVKGVLLHDFPWQFGSWATGYAYIQRAFERGCEDFAAGNIKGIALVIHSGGGMVAGCFDALDKMIEARDAVGVPVRSFAHEGAYSAAYAMAIVANRGIAVSRTGGVGSIGVVTSHFDWSKFNENFGVKVTYIFAGKHKVDGNADEPLPEDVKVRMQERIDELYQVFVSAVARNRGLEESAVRATEALCFTPTQAVSNGLADSIGSLDDAVAAFVADLSPNDGEDQMSNQGNTAVDQAAHEQALTAARDEGRTEGMIAGSKAERERIVAILGCEAAAERPTAAQAAALDSDMTVEQAGSFLGKLPAEPKAPAAAEGVGGNTPFDKAMSEGNPDVGGNASGSDDAPALSLADRVLGKRPAA